MHYRLSRIIKKILFTTGLGNLLWKNLPNGVYVFNYHRVGDRYSTSFDRAVYSCSKESLDIHLKEIKNNFIVISVVELKKIIDEGNKLQKRYALITFDDGYLDNYTDAFPVLQKNKITAAFYLVTDFMGSMTIPWWDEMAFLLRVSHGKSYTLIGDNEQFYLENNNIDNIIQKIIFKAKRLENHPILEVLDHIRKAFPEAVEQLKKQKNALFMTWEQANKMAVNGMEIGSHTLTHQMLAQLPLIEQNKEIKNSKRIIEDKLSVSVNSIAYPVGRYHCYSEDTCNLSKEAGYLIGFNNEPGRNRVINNHFDINRICVDDDELNELKFSSISC